MSAREKFVKVHRAAEILGVAPNTIRAWGAAGKIPEYRHPLNNYRLYKPDDLEQVLAEIEESMMADSTPTKKRRRAK
ncbi:MAG: MerR family DNA-binding transcriptional regulator [Planctomycetia bacterium]|nr:MerR family DNA-binding transcriptional regulator [Planctomycetia bacterium]